jgi:7-keto-8-aminopelargonate synthetase-like enzyme
VAPEAIAEIAAQAEKEKTGARGLMTVLERMVRDYKFELPSTAIRSFTLDRAAVSDPAAHMERLLKQNEMAQRDWLRDEVRQFADRFKAEYGLTLEFDPAAVDRLVEESRAAQKTIRALCEQKFRDYQFGLKLISRNTGQTVFRITPAVAAAPEETLSEWVVASYPKKV